MDKQQRAGTVPTTRAVPIRTARTALGPVHRTLAATPVAVTREPPSLADIQDETPAPNNTGTPTTPTEQSPAAESAAELKGSELAEAREDEKEPGDEEQKGIIDLFDRLGE